MPSLAPNTLFLSFFPRQQGTSAPKSHPGQFFHRWFWPTLCPVVILHVYNQCHLRIAKERCMQSVIVILAFVLTVADSLALAGPSKNVVYKGRSYVLGDSWSCT